MLKLKVGGGQRTSSDDKTTSTTHPTMPQYFLRLSLEHLSFRIPELLSIAQLFEFELKFISEDLSRGVVVIEVEKEEYVERILDRGILVM